MEIKRLHKLGIPPGAEQLLNILEIFPNSVAHDI